MDQSLKQRLVGALVFISLAIIFLPIIFDGQNTMIDTEPYTPPPKPNIEIETVQIEEVEQELQPLIEELDQIAEQNKEIEATPIEETVAEYMEREQTKHEEIQAAQEKPLNLGEAWIIQVGAFQDKENANQFRDRLLAKDYKAYTEAVGTLYKVYVGPEIRQFRLQEQKIKLEQEFQIKPLILKYIP